ncbi:5595_t:CDS:2 [Scutellospora calospora]|uniref:5595_t:CDS:1 n=1 Tax=Scutellospora calospora TaxID=85575 RepID=A0ACA9KS62_9GLOM|nr:5595_t:CDS:2 [Scutellospora calospora]
MPSKSSQWLKEAVNNGYIEFIPYESFTNHKEIARGAYGEVTKAYWSTAEKTVALKSLFESAETENDKGFDDFIKELIRAVDYHDNVIRFYGISQDYRKLYEWAWNQNPDDRPSVDIIRAELEKMLEKYNGNANNVKNTSNFMPPKSPSLSTIPYNQPNNNANKRFSHNNVPPTYQQPGTFNANFDYNANISRTNSDPNLIQNYSPYPQQNQQIYQQMPPYANNNNTAIRPLPPIPQFSNQGGVMVQQQYPNNAPNMNHTFSSQNHVYNNVEMNSGMNNPNQFQQPLYHSVNAGQSQMYHQHSNQNFMPTNFNNQNQPSTGNAQTMMTTSSINTFPQSVPNPGYPIGQQAPINYPPYQQGVQPGVQQSGPFMRRPSCQKIITDYKLNECHAGYHAELGDIEGIDYHLSNGYGGGVNDIYKVKDLNDYLYIIVARYCDDIKKVEEILYLLLRHYNNYNNQLKDPSKRHNLTWTSATGGRTVLHCLAANDNLIRGIDISKEGNENDKKKRDRFHSHITKIIEFLVNNGCDINAKNDKGRTVLGLYLSKNFAILARVIEILLKNGADPNVGVTVKHGSLSRGSSSKIDINSIPKNKNNNENTNNPKEPDKRDLNFPNMLFLAIWYRCLPAVLDSLKNHNVDLDKGHENLNELNLLKMCLQKSQSGRPKRVDYREGLEWVLNNVPKVCGKANLEEVKKLTDKNTIERKLIKEKIGKRKKIFGIV